VNELHHFRRGGARNAAWHPFAVSPGVQCVAVMLLHVYAFGNERTGLPRFGEPPCSLCVGKKRMRVPVPGQAPESASFAARFAHLEICPIQSSCILQNRSLAFVACSLNLLYLDVDGSASPRAESIVRIGSDNRKRSFFTTVTVLNSSNNLFHLSVSSASQPPTSSCQPRKHGGHLRRRRLATHL
jgi:hypothetical protein